jgi:hypothetical protein
MGRGPAETTTISRKEFENYQRQVEQRFAELIGAIRHLETLLQKQAAPVKTPSGQTSAGLKSRPISDGMRKHFSSICENQINPRFYTGINVAWNNYKYPNQTEKVQLKKPNIHKRNTV